MQNQYEEENGKLEKVKQQKEELKKQVEEITEKIENMQNIGFESTNKIEKINSDINVAIERQENNKTNAERYTKEIEDTKIRMQELEEEKKQKQEKKMNLNQNREKFEKELAEKQEELNGLMQKMSTKELEMEQKKQKVEQNVDKKYEVAGEINSQDVNLENLEKRQKVVKQELQSTISELDQVRMEKQEMAKGFYEIENKRNTVVKKLEEGKAKKEESDRKRKEFSDTIDRIIYDIRMKEARYKFLVETEKEKEGYSKSVKNLLLECEKNTSLNKGVHGVLANIISATTDNITGGEKNANI